MLLTDGGQEVLAIGVIPEPLVWERVSGDQRALDQRLRSDLGGLTARHILGYSAEGLVGGKGDDSNQSGDGEVAHSF